MIDWFREFTKLETSAGIALMFAAAFALVIANSPLMPFYEGFLGVHIVVGIGEIIVDKPLLLWINDGLMAVFFFLVGLEIKREFIEGELSSFDKAILPAIAALGGIVVPAGIYVFFNWGNETALRGWAIPDATDIAFALAVLRMVGGRVPLALTVFLLAVAIFDDLAAILIIAVFYTEKLSANALGIAAVAFLGMFAMNRFGVMRVAAYILVGVTMWVAVLKSGVHATVAGVLTALCIPLRGETEEGHSPLKHLEHSLHPYVTYGILPIFGFANAGVSFAGMTLASLLQPVKLGIAAGLFVGKPVGVMLACWLAVRAGIARLPLGVTWMHIFGVSLLCGIGFTMSLFIGNLAFEDPAMAAPVRLGVLTGSLLSAVAGYLVLSWVLRWRHEARQAAPQAASADD